MLVEFSVTNFRSIRDRQTFSMVASKDKDRADTHTFDPDAPATPPLLHSAVVMGPNAGGKSNLLRALHYMRSFVLRSAKLVDPDEKTGVIPFRLDRDWESRPSEFEVVFITGEVRYQYGFALTSERVEEEWLFAWPKGSKQEWFSRAQKNKAGELRDPFNFSKTHFKGRNRIIESLTRDNALFLSVGTQLNHDQLTPLFRWFEKGLQVRSPDFSGPRSPLADYTADRCEEESDFKAKVLSFLQAADLGIDGIKVDSHPMLDDDLSELFSGELRKKILGAKLDIHETFCLHARSDGSEPVSFELEEESDGTQAIYALAGHWLHMLEEGGVVVMDELDTSLHPHLVRFLIEMLHGETNPKHAQLIFSTHDATLLDGVFRRDQIWFVEKGPDRASRVTPLYDFSVRKGEAIQKRYLQGRYGAVPVLVPMD